MAGVGKRLRPHTFTTPKPLLPVAGKPIVQRLVEDISVIYKGALSEIIYISGDFGEEVDKMLLQVADNLGVKGRVLYQDKPLGTAHAIYCAEEFLDGEVVIAFADTLFRADFELDRTKDGMIWVKAVENPKAFGVVTLDKQGIIESMVEKPEKFVSDLAIIGIYYIKEAKRLKEEIKYLLDNKIQGKGEYQLTDALFNMKKKGAQFVAGKVSEWWDCGNKESLLDTNAQVLKHLENKELLSATAIVENSVILAPCFIGQNVKINNSIIGPYVSIGDDATIIDSHIKDSIIRENAQVSSANLDNSIVGKDSIVVSAPKEVNLGNSSTIII